MSNTSVYTFAVSTPLESVAADYAAADTSTKASMRAAREAALSAAVLAGDFDLATYLVGAESVMKATKATPAPVDWTARVRDLRATLVAAVNMIDTGNFVLPDGTEVPDFGTDGYEGGTPDTDTATKLVTLSGRKAVRGSIGAWVDSVLGDDPMTIAQLRSAWVATPDYPHAAPSAGAVGAWLDRQADTDPIACVLIGANQVKGAVRTSDES